MAYGIVFFRTVQLAEITRFYTERIGCRLWMDQGDCKILSFGSFLFGFCQREEAESCGILTFVYSSREEVDRMYEEFRDSALDCPRDHTRYPIYNFFAHDPEERLIELQYFTNQPEEP
jgi:hypothetical protein